MAIESGPHTCQACALVLCIVSLALDDLCILLCHVACGYLPLSWVTNDVHSPQPQTQRL